MQNNKEVHYIEADPKAKLLFFAFFIVWIAAGFILKQLYTNSIYMNIEMANTDPVQANIEVVRSILYYGVIPMSLFVAAYGAYLIFIGVKIIRARIYPPPGMRMPFRTKIKTSSLSVKIMIILHFAFGFLMVCLIVYLFYMFCMLKQMVN